MSVSDEHIHRLLNDLVLNEIAEGKHPLGMPSYCFPSLPNVSDEQLIDVAQYLARFATDKPYLVNNRAEAQLILMRAAIGYKFLTDHPEKL